MNLKDMKKKLIMGGYKITKQRETIFNVFLENEGKHLSPEELHDLVSKKDSNIGIATVYRTLQIFDALDITRKLDFLDNRHRYELHDLNEIHRHHHVVCKECNKVIEVKVDFLDELEKIIETEYDFIINDHDLIFYGTCKECNFFLENKKEK